MKSSGELVKKRERERGCNRDETFPSKNDHPKYVSQEREREREGKERKE